MIREHTNGIRLNRRLLAWLCLSLLGDKVRSVHVREHGARWDVHAIGLLAKHGRVNVSGLDPGEETDERTPWRLGAAGDAVQHSTADERTARGQRGGRTRGEARRAVCGARVAGDG